jgi:hypothetical protein
MEVLSQVFWSQEIDGKKYYKVREKKKKKEKSRWRITNAMQVDEQVDQRAWLGEGQDSS